MIINVIFIFFRKLSEKKNKTKEERKNVSSQNEIINDIITEQRNINIKNLPNDFFSNFID